MHVFPIILVVFFISRIISYVCVHVLLAPPGCMVCGSSAIAAILKYSYY